MLIPATAPLVNQAEQTMQMGCGGAAPGTLAPIVLGISKRGAAAQTCRLGPSGATVMSSLQNIRSGSRHNPNSLAASGQRVLSPNVPSVGGKRGRGAFQGTAAGGPYFPLSG